MSHWKHPVHLLVPEHGTHVGTVAIWFPDGSLLPDGEYYLRGGVCWPTLDVLPQEGIVLVGAWHVRSGRLYVVEERSFLTIEHVLREDGGIKFAGLVSWFPEMWGRWHCGSWFYHQDELTHRRNYLAVLRSAMVEPKPGMVEVPWREDNDARMTAMEATANGRLTYQADGLVHQAIRKYTADPLGTYPALHALVCLTAGLARFPSRPITRGN